jgi:hypothetical protein
MSFILDALKKSEEERLRQQNPSTLPTSALRSSGRTPSWVWALLGLLAVNLVVLAFVLVKPATSLPAAAPVPPSTVTPLIAPSIAPSIATATDRLPSAPDASAPTAMPSAPTPRSDTRPTPAVASLAAVPTRDQQIAAGANLPVTTLNLHVYDADPSKRFILLNGERLRESDASRDGLKVLSITPEGVVLSYGSSSFAVSIEGR